MHRDIKPHNIMFDKSGEIKLIDFGISKITEKGHETRTIGSPIYMAPEVWDKDYGKECDVWSLGVTIYQLLTGDLPVNATRKALLKHKIKNGEFEFPAKSNLTKDCKDLIKKMLKVDPDYRITVQEALDHPWIKKSEHGQTVQNNMNQMLNIETVEKLQRFKGSSIFKKACLNVLIKHLNTDEI